MKIKMATFMKIMINVLVGMACSKCHIITMVDMLVCTAVVGVAFLKRHKRKSLCTQPGNSKVVNIHLFLRNMGYIETIAAIW